MAGWKPCCRHGAGQRDGAGRGRRIDDPAPRGAGWPLRGCMDQSGACGAMRISPSSPTFPIGRPRRGSTVPRTVRPPPPPPRKKARPGNPRAGPCGAHATHPAWQDGGRDRASDFTSEACGAMRFPPRMHQQKPAWAIPGGLYSHFMRVWRFSAICCPASRGLVPARGMRVSLWIRKLPGE